MVTGVTPSPSDSILALNLRVNTLKPKRPKIYDRRFCLESRSDFIRFRNYVNKKNLCLLLRCLRLFQIKGI